MAVNWKRVWKILRNKYILTLMGFVVWITFFSQYSLIERTRLVRTYNQLEQEKEYYLDRIERDSTRLYELTTDNENLEKFAREQYYMKRPNEDLYIVVDKE